MNPISRKLRLTPGRSLFAIGAPSEFDALIKSKHEPGTGQEMPPDAVLLFAKNTAMLKEHVGMALGVIKPDGLLWIAFPKKSSGIQTDLTMTGGWGPMEQAGYRLVSLVSLDGTWSAGRWRKREAIEPSRGSGSSRIPETGGHIDQVRRTVSLPDDLRDALAVNAKARSFFDSLSFTSRKEYVSWILGAKKADTRKRRVADSVRLLRAGARTPFGPK